MIGILTLCSCTKEYYEAPVNDESAEIDISRYGAVGDGQKDCSALINKLIADLPPSGGVIVFPEGDWVLDNPIVVNKNFVTLRGVNPGMRSNIDVADVENLVGPGGGTKLILRNTQVGVHIPAVPAVGGAKNRVSGVEIRDLMISGGTSNKGTGIFVEHDNDRCLISNVIGINLECGIRANAADAMVIKDCWICEVKSSIEMNGGIQNMITNCQLGAQPAGVTCRLSGQTNFLFSGNHVYPDGASNLVLDNCDQVNIANNNFKSYYTAILDLKGDGNLVTGNIFWLAEARGDQLRTRDTDYGVIRVDGSDNLFSGNTVNCEWNLAVANPVTVNATNGTGNRFSTMLITGQQSDRVFYVNPTVVINDCGVPIEKIKVKEEALPTYKAGYLIADEAAADVADDDERASLAWFQKEYPNGDVISPSMLATTDLSAYKVIWLNIDRQGIGLGWDKLPASLLTAEATAALAAYYKNGGNLLLTKHATQYAIPLGRLAADRQPGIFADGAGGDGTDIWTINANIGLQYDHRSHPAFAGMTTSAQFAHDSYPLIGPGTREDHNCMWDLNAYGFPALYPDKENVVKAFEDENTATVLATWGHVVDFCCAGMVEFKPTADYQGSCIAIGLAAYEWKQNSGTNLYQGNIELLTRNLLDYLGGEQ
jgi:hypothetical protein